MSSRTYIAVSSIVAAAGGLIVVASFAFGQVAANWIAFTLSVVALSGSLIGLAVAPHRDAARQRAVAAVVGLVAIWTIIVSVGVFTGGAQHWLIFADGAATVVLASLARERYIAGLVEPTAEQTDSDGREPLRAAA